MKNMMANRALEIVLAVEPLARKAVMLSWAWYATPAQSGRGRGYPDYPEGT